jgi:hypothetical protein
MEDVNMMMNGKLFWVGAALAGVTSGCGTKAVDIGDNDPPAVLGASLSDYEGTWVGYAELANWSDNTDTVKLILDESGNGVIEFGSADPIPAPVAGEAYPPSDDEADPTFDFLDPVQWVISGFSYPIEGAVVESKRIRMASATNALYSDWCGLIEPVEISDEPGSYNCIGYTGWSAGEDGCFAGPNSDQMVDCDVLACVQVCTCDETSCDATLGEDIRLDAALEMEGEELEGSFEVPQGRFFVRMTREE